MGIADDIRPKKYRPISKKTENAAIKKAKKEIEKIDDGRLFDQPYDGDFFGGTPISNTTPVKSHPKGNLRWLYTLIIVMAVITLVGLVVWQNFNVIKSYIDGSYKEKDNQNLTQILDSATSDNKTYEGSTTTTNTPSTSSPITETAKNTTVDKSAITISVLNGSGIKNSAQTVADTLTTAGFMVKGTANAKSFNYQKTIIYYKTGGEAKAELVKDSLPNYQTETNKNDSVVGPTYDIVVVAGKS